VNEYNIGTSAYKLEDYEAYAEKSNIKHQERKKAARAEQVALCRLLTVGVVFVFIAASVLVYVNVMAMRAGTIMQTSFISPEQVHCMT